MPRRFTCDTTPTITAKPTTKIACTIDRTAVARSELTPFIPTFAKMLMSAAQKAPRNAYSHQGIDCIGALSRYAFVSASISKPPHGTTTARFLHTANTTRTQEMFMALVHHSDELGDRPVVSAPARSGASIFAIIAAIASFYFSARGREMWGLLAAILAIGGGLLGGLRALSPRVSGGILSIMAVVLGVIAIVVALIALIV